MSGGYFTTDRARKYGWGVPRLALLTLFAFEVVPRYFLDASGSELNAFAAAEAALADLAQDADEVAVAVPTRLPSLGEAHRIELEQLTALASLVVSGVFAEQLAVLGRRHFL